MAEGIGWNATTWLNLAAIAGSALLLLRFLRTGGPEMLKAMNEDPEEADAHGHHHHCH
jgi:hypothetical protein